MKVDLKNYWNWYYLVTILISIADYIDHISRGDDRFLKIWFPWFLFTFGAVSVIICLTYFINKFLQKLIKKPKLLIELIAVFIPAFIHIRLTGPLLDKLFLGGGTLQFFVTTTIYIIPVSLFLIIRLIHRLTVKN